MKSFLVISFLLFSFHSFGAAKVLMLRGDATFGGHPLKSTSNLKGAGEFVVGDKSYLKILLIESKTEITLGANTTSFLNVSETKTLPELSLLKGMARWVTGTTDSKKSGGIRTKNAAMGIRGTDFFVTYQPLLGETEVICFDGAIEMSSTLVKSENKLVKKNQWGGIGGRFGEGLSRILDLSPELIQNFKQVL